LLIKNTNEVQSWGLLLGLLPLPKVQQTENLEDTMKSIALAAAISLAASTAFAGSYAEPVMEEEVLVEEASSSSAGGVVVGLVVLLVLWAAAQNR